MNYQVKQKHVFNGNTALDHSKIGYPHKHMEFGMKSLRFPLDGFRACVRFHDCVLIYDCCVLNSETLNRNMKCETAPNPISAHIFSLSMWIFLTFISCSPNESLFVAKEIPCRRHKSTIQLQFRNRVILWHGNGAIAPQEKPSRNEQWHIWLSWFPRTNISTIFYKLA